MRVRAGMVWIAVALSAGPGCSLARDAIGRPSGADAGGGAVDGGDPGIDASTPPVDAATPPLDTWAPGADAWAPAVDAWTPPTSDAWTPPPVDAWTPPTPDAWTPPTPRTCSDLYGGQDGFHLCSETTDRCAFVATLRLVASCNDVCGGNGGSCVASYGSGGSDGCTLGMYNHGCYNYGTWDDVCICTHPP